jgi:capsular exopolysaccharide synthesis family protein
MVISVASLGLLAGLVVNYMTATAYMATTVVSVEPDASQFAVPTTPQAPGGLDSERFAQTESNTIRSRDLERRVVRKLRLDQNPQFDIPTGPAGFDRTLTAPWTRIIEPVRAMLGLRRIAPAVEHVPATAAPGMPPSPEQVETPAEARAIETLAANLEVRPPQGGHLFTIAVSSSSAQLAANIANALAGEYANESPRRRRQRIQDQLETIGDHLVELKAQIDADQRTLVDTTPDATLVDNAVIARNVGTAQADVNRKRSVRLAAERKAHEMQGLDLEDPINSAQTHPDVLAATMLLRQQIARVKLDRLTVINRGVAPENVLVKAIDSQIARLEQDLKAEIRQRIEAAERDYTIALSEERAAERLLKAQQNLQVQNSRTGLSYGALKEDLSTSLKLRDDLLVQQKALEIGASEITNNISIVEAAQPPERPYKPNTPLNVLVALAAGLAMGLVLAYVRDRLDDTIKTPEDVSRKLHIPFLGLVPAVRGDRRLVLSNPVPHDFGEAYRALRTSLVFTSGAETTRVITVTSAQPLEGKTTTACNLALVLAFGGSRVLLIDADMRRANVHKALEMVNTVGLSHLLVGQARVREAIQRTSDPNLCVMTAGRTPPNPSELLASERMKQLVANLKQGPFDWVVIDTPPVLAVTDAVILTPLVDGVTFVLGSEMTRRGLAERAVQLLMTGRPKVLGAVLNRVNFERNKYYYSRYYGYHYQSYYGSEPVGTTNPSV